MLPRLRALIVNEALPHRGFRPHIVGPFRGVHRDPDPGPITQPVYEPLGRIPGAQQSLGVMSRYLTSAKNFGSTQVAFGFLIGLVSFRFGLMNLSSPLRIGLRCELG